MSKTGDTGLKERIYESIRDKILSLALAPGDKIPEAQLSEELGVSRPLIREAVLRLSWDGLVKLEPNHPATVIEMDQQMIQDLAFVRWQHDQLAVPLAIYNVSLKDIDQLRALANACIEANNRGDIPMRHSLDAQFHQKIYELSGNRILCNLHYRTDLIVRLWQALHISSPDTLADGLQQHLELIDCLERHDTIAALNIIHQHTTMSFGSDFKGKLLTPQDLLELSGNTFTE